METQREGMELVESLLKGSERINKMKKIIQEFIFILLGFLEWELPVDRILTVVDSRSCKWLVHTHHRHARCMVECFLKDGTEESYVYSTDPKCDPLCLKDVEAVYESLGEFVLGMMKMFPCLEEKWKPLLSLS